MADNKQKVRFEFEEVSTAKTLVLHEPAGVQLINISANPADLITINGIINISPQIAVNNGTARTPGDYTSPTQQNEVDMTTYSVAFPTGSGKLLVIKKYYVTQ